MLARQVRIVEQWQSLLVDAGTLLLDVETIGLN